MLIPGGVGVRSEDSAQLSSGRIDTTSLLMTETCRPACKWDYSDYLITQRVEKDISLIANLRSCVQENKSAIMF